MAQHQAAFLDGKGKPLRVGPIDTKKPGAGEVLVKAAAVAINPVDWKIQGQGGFIKEWPIVLGEDVAGEIVEVGEGVTGLAQGQRVIVHSTFLLSQKSEQGGFQELVIASQASVAILPDAISYEDGVVLPLAVSTAAAGLFQPQAEGLGLDKPSTSSGTEKNGKTLLLWGASSSVGTATIQLAVAAGYDVVATASPRNFGLAKDLGARAVFDYNSPSVVADLVAELKKGDFAGAYDAISTRETQLSAAQVVQQLGGGSVVVVTPPGQGGEGFPETVSAKPILCLTIFAKYPEVGKAVWQDFLPAALKTGQFKPTPPPEVVGKGLESLQGALDKQKAGVSAKKIVVTL